MLPIFDPCPKEEPHWCYTTGGKLCNQPQPKTEPQQTVVWYPNGKPPLSEQRKPQLSEHLKPPVASPLHPLFVSSSKPQTPSIRQYQEGTWNSCRIDNVKDMGLDRLWKEVLEALPSKHNGLFRYHAKLYSFDGTEAQVHLSSSSQNTLDNYLPSLLEAFKKVVSKPIKVLVVDTQTIKTLCNSTINPALGAESLKYLDLDKLWQQFLQEVQPRSLMVLMRQHGKLIAIHGQKVHLLVTSMPLKRRMQKQYAQVQLAFQKVLAEEVTVQLEVKGLGDYP